MTCPDRRSRDLDNLTDPTATAKRLLDDAEKAIRDWNTPPSLSSCSRCLDIHPPLSNCRAHPSRASLCRQLAECFYASDSTKRRGDAFQLLLGLFRSAALMYRPAFAYEKCMICGRLQHQKQCTEATDYLALSMRRDEILRMTITPATQNEFLAMIDVMIDRANVHGSGRVFLTQPPTAKRLHLSLAQQRKRQRHRSPSPEPNQIKSEPDPLWEHTRQLLSPRPDRRCLFCRRESHAHERPCPEFVDPAVVERRRIEVGKWKGGGSEGKIGWLGVLDDLLARLGVSLGGMSSTSQSSGNASGGGGANGSVSGNGGGGGTGKHRSTPAAPQQQQQPNQSQPQAQAIIKKMGCLICTKQTHPGKPCPDRFDPALLDQRKKYIESASMDEQHRAKCLQYICTLLGRLRAPFEVFGLEKLKETREGGSEWAALAAVPGTDEEGVDEEDVRAKQIPRIFKYEFSDSFQKPYLKACYRVVFDPFEKPDETIRRWRTFCVTGDRVIMIAYVDDDGKIRPLQEYEDADEGEELYTCAWSRDPITSSPVLVAAGKRGVLKVFHTRRRTLVRSIPGHGFDVYGLTAHPHHPHIVFSASRDQSIRMWDLHTGRVLAVFSGDGGHKDAVLSVDVQEKGWAIVSGGMDHSIKIWDLKPLEDIINASVERVEAARIAASSSASPSSDPCVDNTVEKYISPYGVHYPYFSTTGVHSNKVDCVRFYGEYILSRSAAEGRVLFWEADGGLPGCGGECESSVDEYGERWYRPTATKFTIWAEFRHPYLESWYYSFHSSTVTHTLVVPHTDDQVRIWDLLDLTYRPYYGTHGRGFRLGTGNDCDLTDENKHGGIKKAACLQAPGGGGGQPDQSNPRGRPKKKEREWLDLRCVTESLDGRVVVAVGSSGWVGVWKRVRREDDEDDEDDSSGTDKGKSRKRSSEDDDDIDVKEESDEDEESEEEVVEEVMVGRGGRVLKRVVRGSIDSGEEDEIGVTIGKSRRVLRSASAASGENIVVEEVEEEVAVGRVLRMKKTE